MAKPDIDDGYYKIANELLAAILPYGFGSIEGYILMLVIEKQYGRSKAKSVKLSTETIQDVTGRQASNIRTCLSKLVKTGVLHKTGEREYRINKDYETWLKPGESDDDRGRRMQFAKDSLKRAKVTDKPEKHQSEQQSSRITDHALPHNQSCGDRITNHAGPHDQSCVSRIIDHAFSGSLPPSPPNPGNTEDRENENTNTAHAHARETTPTQVQPQTPEKSTPDPSLVEFVKGRMLASTGDGVFAEDFAHTAVETWLSQNHDALAIKQAASKAASKGVRSFGWLKYVSRVLESGDVSTGRINDSGGGAPTRKKKSWELEGKELEEYLARVQAMYAEVDEKASRIEYQPIRMPSNRGGHL